MTKSNSTILIVDDEPVGRDALEMLLTAQGYNLAFAGNGIETLSKAAELTPDLILLDVMMPGMDGYEVCRRLRSDPLLADVPIIMVTALDDRDSRLAGIEAGADDFVSKPFNRTELRTRVKTITRLNRFRRLLAERKKFEWVVEQADDGYLIINNKGEISYLNQQARLYLNLSPDQNEIITKTFQELVQEQYRCEPQQAWANLYNIKQISSQQPSDRYLVRPESAISGTFWLHVDMLRVNQPISSNGQSIGGTDWLIRLRDVTEQMVLQRNRWEFQSMVSHKLRTPLIPMLNSLELLALRAPHLSNEETVEFAQIALTGVKQLRNEVDDVLQYMDATGLTKAGSTDRFVLSQLRPTINAICTDLEISLLPMPDLEAFTHDTSPLFISMQAMELILREIIENAKKFHPQKAPTIAVYASSLSSQQFSIQIADNGLTLSPEQLAQVWMPYYQGEKYFTGEANGMGLGLAMVASIVWSIGGACRMYNREAEPGVIVDLILPLVK
ncbi:MAG: response regulator [Anaerolineae bacterium]|nr:response regulator [Anaerolineae bacterium]